MTEQNAKKLYEHFLATGQNVQANDILKAYPHFSPVEIKSKEKK